LCRPRKRLSLDIRLLIQKAKHMPTLQERLSQFNNQFQPGDLSLAGAVSTATLGAGIVYMMVELVRGDVTSVLYFLVGWVLLALLVYYAPARQWLLGEANKLNMRHLLHIIFYWLFSTGALMFWRLLGGVDAAGKDSRLFYVFLVALVGFSYASLRSLAIPSRPGAYRHHSTGIPLWEQTMLAANEVIAVGLVSYVWSSMLVRVFQPDVFTTRLNLTYSLGLGAATLLYYIGVQLMWVQRLNDWISRNEIWLRFARIVTPFVLLITTALISSRFTVETDSRTATLVANPELDFAVRSLVPVVWMLVFIVMVIVYTGRRGLRQRFLPDSLLEHLPGRTGQLFRAISDMDVILLISLMTTFIPTVLLFFGGDGGVIGEIRLWIEQRGSAFIESSEQALAIVFVLPFYLLIMLVLVIYALVISRPAMSSTERDEMMDRLPVGFLITMILVLYMFAVPFTQVFIEGRLPTPTRDLGRILVFYLLIPLILLYVHFLPLVRFPYGRGQGRWRTQEATRLEADLRDIDRRIRNLNQELTRMDNQWRVKPPGDDMTVLKNRIDSLHHYIQLNSERDDLNMRRLQILGSRQNLSEISDMPLSVTVGRLPLRIISIGLPLLLLFQLYQWAVVSDGLRQVVNDPNITLVRFIQILLENIEI
jgi:hypothetical protein